MSKRGTDDASILKPISVKTGALNPNERFDFLNDIYARERLILAPKRPLGNSITAGSSLWEVGSLRYALTFSSGHIGRRVREKSSAVLAIRKHFTGGCHSWSEDGYFVTQPGDIIVTLNTVDGVHACGKLYTTNLALPLDVLDLDFKRTTQILPAGTLGNRLLSVGMEAWTQELESMSGRGVELLEKEIISLVNHVLGTSGRAEADGDLEPVRAKAMRRYVEEHLFSDDLGVEQICDRFGASRASVYRAFSAEGGVRRYASNLRLRKALFLLNESPPRRGAISDVAAQLGYDDPLRFSKVFRAHFGFPPSDVLALKDPTLAPEASQA